jgi:hypothetical protein
MYLSYENLTDYDSVLFDSKSNENRKEHFSEIHKVNATVLCHFYNEEYLLPFWLKHHRKIFQHGVMIDYHSTDNSREIIKKLCPTWEIITSRNEKFQADSVDKEVMSIEEKLSGYKIALNVTEFLIATKPFERSDINKCFSINSYTILPESTQIDPADEIQFINQINKVTTGRGIRVLHSFTHGSYDIGRHASFHSTEDISGLFIVWCGYYPWNEFTIKRKLQIKDNIPESDKIQGFGFHHLWDKNKMESEIKSLQERPQIRFLDLMNNEK